jgi:hypothetical protein
MCMGDLKWLVHGIEVPTMKSKDTRKNQMLSLSNGRGMVWETEGSSDSTTGLARKGFNAQVELPMTCVWIEVFGKIETKEYDAPAFLIPRCSTDFSFWIRIVPIIWHRIGGTRINYMTSDWGTWGISFWGEPIDLCVQFIFPKQNCNRGWKIKWCTLPENQISNKWRNQKASNHMKWGIKCCPPALTRLFGVCHRSNLATTRKGLECAWGISSDLCME